MLPPFWNVCSIIQYKLVLTFDHLHFCASKFKNAIWCTKSQSSLFNKFWSLMFVNHAGLFLGADCGIYVKQINYKLQQILPSPMYPSCRICWYPKVIGVQFIVGNIGSYHDKAWSRSSCTSNKPIHREGW